MSGIKPAIVLDNVAALFESEGNHTYQLCDLRAPAASGSLLRGDSPRNPGAGVSATWKKPHRGQGTQGVLCTPSTQALRLIPFLCSCAPGLLGTHCRGTCWTQLIKIYLDGW